MSDIKGPDSPVALVTGARRGIGAAICDRLADAGMAVAANDLPDPGGAAAEDRHHAASRGDRLVVLADVSDPDEARRMVDHVAAHFERLDVLVNNAAVTAVHKPWSEISADEFWHVLRVNLAGPFHCARAAHPYLRQSGRGRIINIASTAVLLGAPNMLHYVSAKSGLIGMTRALARELGDEGITVNTVCPGAIQTEAEFEAFPDQDGIASFLAGVQAISRRGQPIDVAAAVSFLATEEAGFITGQLINVDGGWAMH